MSSDFWNAFEGNGIEDDQEPGKGLMELFLGSESCSDTLRMELELILHFMDFSV